MDDFRVKVSLLRKLISQKQIRGILITQQKNFSWMTSGRAFVNLSVEKAVASILVTTDAIVLIVSQIEVARIMEEEITGEFDKIEIFPWYDPAKVNTILDVYSEGGIVETDITLESELLPIRTVLTNNELERIRQLGHDTASALEETVMQIRSGESEFDISARLSANCIKRGIEPVVNLVAADERAFSRRHPLPTSRILHNYAMVVICARSKGLTISATRSVHFGQPSAELLHRHWAVAEVDSVLIGNTHEKRMFADLFEKMKQVYAEVGYPDEWVNHHQGGLTGYSTRELLLLPNSQHMIGDRQAYAWNPSIAGVKSEDTILINGSSRNILTYTGNFPTVEIKYGGESILRPDILVRKGLKT